VAFLQAAFPIDAQAIVSEVLLQIMTTEMLTLGSRLSHSDGRVILIADALTH